MGRSLRCLALMGLLAACSLGAPPPVFYVRNDVTTSGSGSASDPFQTLARAVSAATGKPGARIVLYQGDGTTRGLDTPVNLQVGQTLCSENRATPATITGPVNLAGNNTVRDLRIIGTAGSAINATDCDNGVLANLEILGASQHGVCLTNATGTFSLTNSSLQNLGGHGLLANCEWGKLSYSVDQCSFANVTEQDIFSNPTKNAALNATVQNSESRAKGLQFIYVEADTTAPGVLTMSNNTVQGDAKKIRGLSLIASSSTRIVAIISGNKISRCLDSSIRLQAEDSASLKASIKGNQVDKIVLLTSGIGDPTFRAVVRNNASETFTTGNSTGIFQIESLADFNAASNNTGTLVNDKAQTAAKGSIQVP